MWFSARFRVSEYDCHDEESIEFGRSVNPRGIDKERGIRYIHEMESGHGQGVPNGHVAEIMRHGGPSKQRFVTKL